MPIVTIIGSLLLGVSLAASCGLRAFLPLFVVGLGARLGLIDIGEHFEWLASAPALLALGVGVACELLADKLPVVNHLLDLLATPVRTVAGMMVCGAALVDLPTWVVALLAIIIGGGVALSVHVAKSAARAQSTVATGGAGGPVHSTVEDVVCCAAAVLSVIFQVVAVVVAAAALVLLWLSVRAVVQRWRR